ncbi:Tetratricopeptide repeat protein 26 [Trachymyrmex septentrionalis]|uniref:Tetratricopeptide repeat protein 26 n=1 Tax=Trachymyrmex septentrionalis TaxID=34720 RepID=A0A151JZP0_9HYME|nr:Tetratricopeptide repeat protein 26 [Trachymyrmex septentrionalis]
MRFNSRNVIILLSVVFIALDFPESPITSEEVTMERKMEKNCMKDYYETEKEESLNFLNLREVVKPRTIKSIKSRFQKVISAEQLRRWEKQMNVGGSRLEKLGRISADTKITKFITKKALMSKEALQAAVIQPIISADGRLLSSVLIMLKEPSGTLSPRYILNRTMEGDWDGEYTYVDYRDSTVTDYLIVNEAIRESIREFAVEDRVDSDHLLLGRRKREADDKRRKKIKETDKREKRKKLKKLKEKKQKEKRLLSKYIRYNYQTCKCLYANPVLTTFHLEYEEWLITHESNCSANHTGSSGKMMLSNLSILSRAKPASSEGVQMLVSRKEIPKLEEFLEKRDYTGALTLLEFNTMIYENLKNKDYVPPEILTNLACCYFYLGMYSESQKILEEADNSKLQTRLLFHLAHKMGNESKLMKYHQMLQDIIEDQLSLASIHYLQAHYQEAIDVYKKILLDNRDYLALNVYVALCYYKLDYYDVAQEVLQVYLQKYPDSTIAINLKACNHFRLYDGNAAQVEMKQLVEKISSSFSSSHDLIQHNTVVCVTSYRVFRGGENALQILPNLVDVIPEARLNLVIYYLKQDDIKAAYDLIKDLEPAVPQEYILKGIVNAVMGQETNSNYLSFSIIEKFLNYYRDSIKTAQQYFQLVGSSASECDTIPGRQCMASFFFLYRQFERVRLYLNSIKTYFSNQDNFNFNYAQAQAGAGYFKEAEEAFLMIRNEKYKNDYIYISLLSYCYIMNEKAELAWELYLKMDTSAESFNLLQLIANVCYKVGEFWYAAKAFDMLERMDPSPEHWEGKRGACCGAFQYIIAEKLPKELLSEVIQILKNTSNSQVEQIIRVMRKWGKENRVNC